MKVKVDVKEKKVTPVDVALLVGSKDKRDCFELDYFCCLSKKSLELFAFYIFFLKLLITS